jgi:hypothetical protein
MILNRGGDAVDRFSREALARLPLAEAAWNLLAFAFEGTFLTELFEQHRGTGWEQRVTFPLLVELVYSALTEHAGSGRQSFAAAREAGRLEATDEAVYGKLRRLPIALSEALLRETTKRLGQVAPVQPTNPVLEAFAGYRIVVLDGKKIKNLPKRMKPPRNTGGSMLGGVATVGLLLNTGQVIAMQATPDGEANEAPLTPGLLDQIAGHSPQPFLMVADRQFSDLIIPQEVADRGGDFVIRLNKKMHFHPETIGPLHTDARGRQVQEAWGFIGGPDDPRRRRVRQITLLRPGEEDVILLTSLLDSAKFPAEQLLALYLDRWEIERAFQQVTEVFHLQCLISSSPQGALFQFALCSLLYNVIQIVRSYVAEDRQISPRALSSEMLFTSIRKQMTAATTLIPPNELLELLGEPLDAERTRQRLKDLLRSQWPQLWLKSPPKRRIPKHPQKTIPGNHSSAWKILQQSKPNRPSS